MLRAQYLSFSCLFALYVVGVYLFSSGFLLSRNELTTKQHCSFFNILSNNQSKNQTVCNSLFKPKFQKAVFVMIDALRFDFVSPSPKQSFYTNKLPIFNKLLTESPSNSLLIRSRADPPTTTLQRLKALMTGTLPTFVDAGSNFGGNQIKEDNLIDQLLTSAQKSIAFMGDDTWMGLFPSHFNQSYPFPSFDVWDLHTVDNGVVDQLFPLLNATHDSWQVIIAHFLGVDHAGHRYGPSSIAMSEKLTQVNGWLEKLFQQVDEDTVVFVLGDHGMDPKGDHGGDSPLEVDTTTFIYSPKKIISTDPKLMKFWNTTLARLEKQLPQDQAFVKYDHHRSAPQIDFVPTFALLMGIPIPFGNLGSIIPELFLSTTTKQSIETLLQATRLNSHQIFNYINEYTKTSTDIPITTLQALFSQAERSFIQYQQNMDDDEQGSKVFIEYMVFMRTCLLSAREIWAKFNMGLIGMGMVILIFGFLMTFLNGLRLTSQIMGLTLSTISMIFVVLFDVNPDKIGIWSFTAFVGSCTYCIYMLAIHFRTITFPDKFRVSTFMAILLSTLHILIPASDSFTIWEEWITFYLLQTYGVYLCCILYSRKRSLRIWYAVAFLVFNRITHTSSICRVEHGTSCIPTFNHSSTMSVASLYSIPVLALTQFLVWYCLGMMVLDEKEVPIELSRLSLFPCVLASSVVYWSLDTMEGHGLLTGDYLHLLTVFKLWVAKVGFWGGVPLMLVRWFFDPLFYKTRGKIYHLPPSISKNKISSSDAVSNAILNVQYNSSGLLMLKLTSIIYTAVVFTQKPMGGIMIGLGFIKILCLLHIWNNQVTLNEVNEPISPVISRKHDIPIITQCEFSFTDVEYLTPLIFYLIGVNIFFNTGHQTTFSSMQFEIGFIGITQVSWIASPVYMVLNTFGGFVLAVFGVLVHGFWKKSSSSDNIIYSTTTYLKNLIRIVFAMVIANAGLAAHFRRHLMVWSVFAPRFIFAGVWGGVVILSSSIIGFGFFVLILRRKNGN